LFLKPVGFLEIRDCSKHSKKLGLLRHISGNFSLCVVDFDPPQPGSEMRETRFDNYADIVGAEYPHQGAGGFMRNYLFSTHN
jgi:hypothetical protein